MSDFLVGPFVYFHTSCVRTAKALARLRGCAGSPEPSLVAYVISTIISRAGSFVGKLFSVMQNKTVRFCSIENQLIYTYDKNHLKTMIRKRICAIRSRLVCRLLK